MARTQIVVTMPAYQAERTLEKTISDLPAHLDARIIVVDDASTDGTVDVAEALGVPVIRHEVNRGYGANQKTCYEAALGSGADVVVMLHPDYQYDPRAVPLLIAPILSGDADMTFGSRFAGLADPRAGGMPLYRYFGNRFTTITQNLLLGTRFTELHSGMRAYSRDFLMRTPFRDYSDGFAFDSELLTRAITSGRRVVEVPIPTRYTRESSSISVRSSLAYVFRSIWLAFIARTMDGRRGIRRPDNGNQGPRMGRMRRAQVGECVLCGSPDLGLIYPATVAGPIDPDEFKCTTSALAVHDDILQCARCGMISSAPTAEPEQILEGYREVSDGDYLKERTARAEVFNWILDRVDAYQLPGRKLFEAGSHVGLFLREAADRGWEAQGIEPSEWAVAWGRNHLHVAIDQGAIEEYETSEVFDCVAMFDVLEHVVDPRAALIKMRSLLHDEGLLSLTTVDVESVHSRLRRSRWPWYIRSHLHYFSPTTLGQLLNQCGFELIEWKTVPRSFRLSYVLDRAGASLGWLGAVGRAVSRYLDPRLPASILGDICFVLARPIPASKAAGGFKHHLSAVPLEGSDGDTGEVTGLSMREVARDQIRHTGHQL